MARPSTPKSLSARRVLIGGALGILCGAIFGDYCRLLAPVGQIYVMLLEVAVYPYLACSLLHGLGSMEPGQAKRLFARGWIFYGFLWAVTFGTIALLITGIPEARPSSLAFTPETGVFQRILDIIIPANLFEALNRNYVPAVVLFCIMYGVALQQVKSRAALLNVLDAVREASLRFWNAIVPFAPVAVFALFADTAGTTRVRDLESIGLYFALFFFGALVLTFVVIPWFIKELTPLSYREVLRETRSALGIAAVTTLSVAALPYITAATLRLADRLGLRDAERDDIVRTNISMAYPLGQLGNFFVYLFIAFALFFYGVPISPLDRGLMPFISLLACSGSPTSSVNSVQFFASWLGLPEAANALYVELMSLTRYGQVLVSVMGFAFLSFTVTLAYYGRVRFRPMRLLAPLATGAIALFAFAAGAGKIYERFFDQRTNPYLDFTLDPAVTRHVPVTFGDADSPAAPLAGPEPVLARIQRTGELRVGYNPGVIPFSYRNAKGGLVGFDISFAYRLARNLNARLRFIPMEWPALAGDLKAGRFDIAMSGVYVTEDRLATLEVSEPYFQSPLAFFLPRDRAELFSSREKILSRPNVRIGVFNDPVLLPRLKRSFPNATPVIVHDYNQPPDFSKMDAAFWTFEQADALAAAHPQLIAVAPRGEANPFLFAYLMPPGSEEFRRFVNYWLQLQRSNGFAEEQTSYWIKRLPRGADAPRWSILRNVLGVGLDQKPDETQEEN